MTITPPKQTEPNRDPIHDEIRLVSREKFRQLGEQFASQFKGKLVPPLFFVRDSQSALWHHESVWDVPESELESRSQLFQVWFNDAIVKTSGDNLPELLMDAVYRMKDEAKEEDVHQAAIAHLMLKSQAVNGTVYEQVEKLIDDSRLQEKSDVQDEFGVHQFDITAEAGLANAPADIKSADSVLESNEVSVQNTGGKTVYYTLSRHRLYQQLVVFCPDYLNVQQQVCHATPSDLQSSTTAYFAAEYARVFACPQLHEHQPKLVDLQHLSAWFVPITGLGQRRGQVVWMHPYNKENKSIASELLEIKRDLDEGLTRLLIDTFSQLLESYVNRASIAPKDKDPFLDAIFGNLWLSKEIRYYRADDERSNQMNLVRIAGQQQHKPHSVMLNFGEEKIHTEHDGKWVNIWLFLGSDRALGETRSGADAASTAARLLGFDMVCYKCLKEAFSPGYSDVPFASNDNSAASSVVLAIKALRRSGLRIIDAVHRVLVGVERGESEKFKEANSVFSLLTHDLSKIFVKHFPHFSEHVQETMSPEAVAKTRYAWDVASAFAGLIALFAKCLPMQHQVLPAAQREENLAPLRNRVKESFVGPYAKDRLRDAILLVASRIYAIEKLENGARIPCLEELGDDPLELSSAEYSMCCLLCGEPIRNFLHHAPKDSHGVLSVDVSPDSGLVITLLQDWEFVSLPESDTFKHLGEMLGLIDSNSGTDVRWIGNGGKIEWTVRVGLNLLVAEMAS